MFKMNNFLFNVSFCNTEKNMLARNKLAWMIKKYELTSKDLLFTDETPLFYQAQSIIFLSSSAELTR